MGGKLSFLRRIAVGYLRFVLRHPYAVLAIMAAVTSLFALQLLKLTFATSVYDLIIEKLPENTRYLDFEEKFGSDEIIRVVVKAEDIFAPEAFASLAALSSALGEIQGVERVIGLPEVREKVDPGGRWPMERFAAVMKPVSLFERNLFSADRKTAALTLMLARTADYRATVAAVQRAIDAARPPGRRYPIGMSLVSLALEDFTRRDFCRLPPVTFLLIAIVLYAIFRRFGDMMLPLVCVAVTLVWTFGFMAFTGTPLALLTMIVPVFLIAVGTAYCLHVIAEYRIWICRVDSAAEAVEGTFRHGTLPLSMAILTTIIGLASLFTSGIPMICEFAFFACFGMLSLMIVLLSLFPALLSLVPLPADHRATGDPADGPMARFLETVVGWPVHHPKPTLVLFALATVLSLAGIFQLKAETNPVRYFKPEIDVRRHFDEIAKDLCGAFPVHLVIGGHSDFFEDPARVALLERVQRELETLPGIDKTIGLADYLKLVNYATNGFDGAHYALAEEAWALRMLYNNFKTLLGDEMFRRFVTMDLSTVNIVMMTHLSSSADVMALRRSILQRLDEILPAELSREVTGFSVVISASSHLLTRGQIRSLGLTMAVIFGIMFMLFLSSRVGMIAIAPNVFPILINFGVMGWLGIELSMFTSLIASIAIGLAVDDTIHYLVRYNREFKLDLNDERAFQATLHHIGRPIVFTSLTICVGFLVLTFSSFAPTAVFGLMMVVTMIAALAGDLLLLPLLMRHVQLVTLWDLVRVKLGADPGEGLPLFHGLSRTEVHYIIVAGALRQVPAGAVVYRKGDASDSMYAVISGELEVLDHPAEADPAGDGWDVTRVGVLRTGDLLGEMGMLRRTPRSATVVARQPTEMLQINMNMIRRLQWLYPPAAQRFFLNLMKLLCNRVENVSHCLFASSQMDDLSGLCNRRAFMQLLDRELGRSRRYGSELTLCLVQVGDGDGWALDCQPDARCQQRNAFLRQLPRLLRQSDIIGRVDARTLGLVMPHTTAAAARHFCVRLRRIALEANLPVTIQTIGPGEVPDGSGEALLNQAAARCSADTTGN